MMATLDVEFEAVSDADGRFARLAQLLGLADADHARGKVEHLWMACTTRGETDLPQWLVEKHLGASGPAALVEAELARWGRGRGDSKTRRMYICGAKQRCLWLRHNQEQAPKGGKARAAKAIRGASGQFQPNPAPSPSPSPSPGDPESLPPARDPAVPDPDPDPEPRASPPAAQQVGSEPASNARPATPPDPPSYDPADPRAIGRLAEATWRRISDAASAIAAELKLPAPIPFPEITPSTQRRGFVELKDRIREEGALASTVCDAVVENLVKQARAKRSVEWLAEKAFGDKAWVNARNGIDPSARTARPENPRRDQPPPMPTPPKFAPEPPPRSPEELAADWAANKAAAARTVPELLPMFGDPEARAGPSSAAPTDHDPDENHRRRKATK